LQEDSRHEEQEGKYEGVDQDTSGISDVIHSYE
jgi:hypothetical protein